MMTLHSLPIAMHCDERVISGTGQKSQKLQKRQKLLRFCETCRIRTGRHLSVASLCAGTTTLSTDNEPARGPGRTAQLAVYREVNERTRARSWFYTASSVKRLLLGIIRRVGITHNQKS